MTLGITLLLLFAPLVGIFIGSNFDTIAGYVDNALSILAPVPDMANALWNILPSGVTNFIIAVFVIGLSVALIRRIVGGTFV